MRQSGAEAMQSRRAGKPRRAADDLIDELVCPVDEFSLLPGPCMTPERSLMLGVLELALNEYGRKGKLGKEKSIRLSKEAAHWIQSDNSGWFYSFPNVCDHLGIHPEYLRRRLSDVSQRRSLTVADAIFDSLSIKKESISRGDIERAVVKAFGCEGITQDSRANRGARVAYFRALMMIKGYSEKQVLRERVRLGWKYSTVYLKHLYSTHIHARYADAIKDEIERVLKKREDAQKRKRKTVTAQERCA